MASAGQFTEEVLVVDLDVEVREEGSRPGATVVSTGTRSPAGEPRTGRVAPLLGPEAEVYQALVLGTRDYVAKNGFSDAVIGLSGGIDSSLVAAVAVDALGPDHVHGVTMPSRYSSGGSVDDAVALAANLGVDIVTVAIEPAHQAFAASLSPLLGGEPDRPHRREPPVPDPGRAPHGAVQRAGVDRAHHGQQERDGDRLLHPVRGLGRRIRGHQGRPEDCSSTSCAGTATGWPVSTSSPSRC